MENERNKKEARSALSMFLTGVIAGGLAVALSNKKTRENLKKKIKNFIGESGETLEEAEKKLKEV